MPASFVIREMETGDLPSVIAIENASFGSPWSLEMMRSEVGQRLGWSRVAVEPGAGVVGFIIGRRYPDVWHVMDLAVAPRRRRRGVGGTLLADFLKAADLAGMEVVLEVRQENREATALYATWGFEVIAVRRRYYTDSGEDALVMSRPVGAGRPEPRSEALHGPLLAIESSCDDSAAAVLSPAGEVLASISHSQDAIHERYGGVVPEVASRAHVERMTAVVREALRQAGCGVGELGGVAATVGPGLIGALLVGVQTAKAIAWSGRLPFFPVNHLHGHLAAAWLTDPKAPFPMVTLVASGGHTLLIRVDDRKDFRLLGQTLDDAAGEAFDKGARLLGLGYPGVGSLTNWPSKGTRRPSPFPSG